MLQKKVDPQQTPATVDDATTRISSLTLNSMSGVTIDTDEYIDFSARQISETASSADSMHAVILPSTKAKMAKGDAKFGVQHDKATLDFWRAAGMDDIEILGVMSRQPTADSLQSLFAPPNSMDRSDSLYNTSNSEGSSRSSELLNSTHETTESFGVSLCARPVSAMPSAPRMKPKRPDSAKGAIHDPDSRSSFGPFPFAERAWETAAGAQPSEEEIEAERRRIQSNFDEFLAQAEARLAGENGNSKGVAGTAQDPETKEYEAIFLEESESPSTADVAVSRSSSGTENESNPWWNLKTQ